MLLRFILLLTLVGQSILAAPESRIIKVLPHYVDLKGRHSVSPSLYDRDAYQLFLRENVKEQGGLRFDVQWKAPRKEGLEMMLEIRGGVSPQVKNFTITAPLKSGWKSNWARIPLSADQFKELGHMTAWRVSLWDGQTKLGEEKSFLW